MSEQAFGRRRPWSVGVEEEIMLLDAETLELVPASSDLLDEAQEPRRAGSAQARAPSQP